MPPNLANTMFARWYNQQIADRTAQRENDAHQADMLSRNFELASKQREQDRAEIEAKAKLMGEQASVLGEAPPAPEDPGLSAAVREGTQTSRVNQILADRAAQHALKLQRLKDLGAIDRTVLAHQLDMDAKAASDAAANTRERETRTSAEKVARGNNATSVQVAEINANKPQRGALTVGLKMGADADKLTGALGELKQLSGNDYGKYQGVGPSITKMGEAARAGASTVLPALGLSNESAADYENRKRYDAVRARIQATDIHAFAGSAQTKYEMQRLKDAILGGQFTDPIAFKATVDELYRLAQRQKRLSAQVMMSGSYMEGTPEFDAAVERLEQGEAQAGTPVIQGAPKGPPLYRRTNPQTGETRVSYDGKTWVPEAQ